MANKKKQDWIPLNEAITDFIEIKRSHYNTRIPTFTLLPVRRFVKFDGSKITVKSVSHYNMNENYIPVITYGSAICDPDNSYTKGFGIDLAFRKASEKMERKCKKLLITYSKDHMLVPKESKKIKLGYRLFVTRIRQGKNVFNIKFRNITYRGKIASRSNFGTRYELSRYRRPLGNMIHFADRVVFQWYTGRTDRYELVDKYLKEDNKTAVYVLKNL